MHDQRGGGMTFHRGKVREHHSKPFVDHYKQQYLGGFLHLYWIAYQLERCSPEEYEKKRLEGEGLEGEFCCRFRWSL